MNLRTSRNPRLHLNGPGARRKRGKKKKNCQEGKYIGRYFKNVVLAYEWIIIYLTGSLLRDIQPVLSLCLPDTASMTILVLNS